MSRWMLAPILGPLVAACAATTPSAAPRTITTEVECFQISVPDTFTIIDRDRPGDFADAVMADPEVDDALATIVVMSALGGNAPEFWAFDLSSAVEGEGVVRGVNVIGAQEPAPSPLEEFLPRYLAGLSDGAVEAVGVEGDVIEINGTAVIEATLRTMDGPDSTPVNTASYVIPESDRTLVLSVTSRPEWMDGNRGVIREIAGSIRGTCPG